MPPQQPYVLPQQSHMPAQQVNLQQPPYVPPQQPSMPPQQVNLYGRIVPQNTEESLRQKKEPSIYCPNCGTENKIGAKFCTECGKSMI